MFEDVIGNDEAKKFLENNINSKNISHAYLFVGKSGIGKKKIALELSQKILNTDNLKSCLDFKYIEKLEDNKNITVEQVRNEIVNDVHTAPIEGNKKIYVIDNIENLNEASQNALLKTIEEPPKYVTIILICSNTSNILSTILSRVTKVEFKKLSTDEIKKYVALNLNANITENTIKFIDGSIGLLENLIKAQNMEIISKVEELYSIMTSKNIVKCMLYRESIDFTNEYALAYLEFLMYINSKYYNIDYIEKAKKRLENNGNKDIVLDNLMIQCIKGM